MNKLIIGAIIVIIAVVVLQNQSRPTTIPLPNIDDVGDSSCTLPTSSCNDDVLTFYRCSEGEVSEVTFNCSTITSTSGEGWCNSQQTIVKNGESITRANCDIREFRQVITNQTQQSITEVENVEEVEEIQNSPPLAYCGNGVIDADETCTSCAEDFTCSEQEFCDEQSGLCTKINSFGDQRCTQQENASNADCASCGCQNQRVCNQLTQQCQQGIQVTASLEQQVNFILEEHLANNFTYLGLVDTIYHNQSAKMLVIDCNPQNEYFCRTFIIINAQGEILETVETS